MSPEYWRSPEGRKVAAALVALLMGGGLAACGDDGGTAKRDEAADSRPAQGGKTDVVTVEKQTDQREFVGKVDGNENIYVAVMLFSDEDKKFAGAYICDGGSTAEFFLGRDGPQLDLTSRKDGKVVATVQDANVTGTVTRADGTQLQFSASEVPANGPAGLYLVTGREESSLEGKDWGAWVVLPDGTQRGNIQLNNQLQPGGQLDPATGTVTLTAGRMLRSRSLGFISPIADV